MAVVGDPVENEDQTVQLLARLPDSDRDSSVNPKQDRRKNAKVNKAETGLFK